MIWAIAALLAGLAVVAGAARDDDGSLPPGTEVNPQGFAEIRKLAREAGMPKDYEDFLVFVAYGESKGNNLVGLGNPALFPPWSVTHLRWVADGQPKLTKRQMNEAAAARRGYDDREWLHGCWPRNTYIFGSGGWFALLPSTGLAAYRNTPMRCQHPWSVFDGPASVVMAIETIRRLRGWSTYQENPTFIALRAGWGAPGKMNDPAHLKERRARYVRHLKAVGLPPSFLDKQPPPLPAIDPVSLTQALGGMIALPGSV